VEDITLDEGAAKTKASSSRAGAWRILVGLLLVAMAVVWVVWFRPQAIGGSASYVEVTSGAMAPTIPRGDLAVVERQPRYQTGDIVAFRAPSSPVTVVGRVIGGNATTGFVVKGDGLALAYPFQPRGSDVVGRVWFHVQDQLRWPLIVVAAMAIVVLMVAAWPERRHRPSLAVPAGPSPTAAGAQGAPGLATAPPRARERRGTRFLPKRRSRSLVPSRPPVAPGADHQPAPAAVPGDSYWAVSPRLAEGSQPAKRRRYRRRRDRPPPGS
jgi:signal peptidase I